MTPIRIAVIGCSGRMGRALIRLLHNHADATLAAAVTTPDDPCLGQDAGPLSGLARCDVPLATSIEVPCDVAIEFTLPAGCATWADWCAAHRVPLVSGTTGLNDAQHRALQDAARRVPVVWAPNMSVGINLMLELVAELTRRLGSGWDIEISESHHRNKVDAPSGTAQALLREICAARGQPADEAARHGRHGTPGPRTPDEIGVHALRLGALIGEHEVHFADDHETLTVGHRALSRDTFAAGAIRAARWVVGRSPGLYDMRAVLRDA